MSDLVRFAARNNAEWCDAVCRSWALPGSSGRTSGSPGIRRLAGKLPLLDYETDEALAQSLALGFIACGPMTIWGR